MIKCQHEIENKKPDINSERKKLCWFGDIACPADNYVGDKEERNVEKYDF